MGKANLDRENEQHLRFKVGDARKGREQIYENMTNYNEKMVGGWKDDFNFVLVFVRPDLHDSHVQRIAQFRSCRPVFSRRW